MLCALEQPLPANRILSSTAAFYSRLASSGACGSSWGKKMQPRYSVLASATLAVWYLTVWQACVCGKSLVAPSELNSLGAGSRQDPAGNSVLASATESFTTEREDIATNAPTTTTISASGNEVPYDDIPTFNRKQVSLDLPGDLFSSTANLTLSLRNFIADLITVSRVGACCPFAFTNPTAHADHSRSFSLSLCSLVSIHHHQRTSVRIAQVVRFFQPLFGYHLMIDIPKELDV